MMSQRLANLGDQLCRFRWLFKLGLRLHDRYCERCRKIVEDMNR